MYVRSQLLKYERLYYSTRCFNSFSQTFSYGILNNNTCPWIHPLQLFVNKSSKIIRLGTIVVITDHVIITFSPSAIAIPLIIKIAILAIDTVVTGTRNVIRNQRLFAEPFSHQSIQVHKMTHFINGVTLLTGESTKLKFKLILLQDISLNSIQMTKSLL